MELKNIPKDKFISQWQDFNIDHTFFMRLIQPLESEYNKSKNSILIQSYDSSFKSDISLNEYLLDKRQESLSVLFTRFELSLEKELNKVSFFFTQNMSFYQIRQSEIKNHLAYIHQNKNSLEKFEDLLDTYELALKELYKEIQYMKRYLDYNFSIKDILVKLIIRYSNCIPELSKDKEIDINEYSIQILEQSGLSDCYESLSNLKKGVEQIFEEHFYSKYSDQSLAVLKKHSQVGKLSHRQVFLFGFTCGTLFLMVILEILIGFYFGLDIDYDRNFRRVFPVFRGYILSCLFIWVLAANVFVWNSNHINYQLCFKFTSQCSSVYEILYRASFFSFIGLFGFLFFVLTRNGFFLEISNEIFPLACWIILVIYILFPSLGVNFLNYQGRMYFLKLLSECLASILIPCEFKHVWLTDQLTSFIGPIRDIEYSICYYTHDFFTYKYQDMYCSRNRYIVLIAGMAPNVLRILQVKLIYIVPEDNKGL